jgi:Cft2 family RNA processing exonuclease
MQVKFIGAIERVTGSCAWLKHGDIQFLVDCGMIQGEKHSAFENGKEFIFKARNLKFVFLTHSHLDHCGLIPRLYKDGFMGKVYCTRATAKLAREIMLDASRISALYDESDIDKVQFLHIDEIEGFKWGKLIPVDQDLFFNVFRSAHILGSVSIGFSWSKAKGKSILFTGDIGNNTKSNSYQPLLKGRQSPDAKFGYIVCESTYGARERDSADSNFESRIESLENVIIDTLYKKGGDLVIPTFSMHRTQEILFDLYYLMNVKWNGSVKKKNHKIPIMDYLKRYDFLHQSIELKKSKLDQLLNFTVIPNSIREMIFGCYFPVYSISKKEFNKLSGFAGVELFTRMDGGRYQLYPYDIGSHGDTLVIEKRLIDNEIEHKKLYKFEFEEIDKSLCDLSTYVVEIEEFPIKVLLDSKLGQKITKIYGQELTASYYNGNEQKKLYLNSNIQSWLNLSGAEVDEGINKLFTKDLVKVGEHEIQSAGEGKGSKTQPKSKASPSIIISSSGMCDAGKVLGHLNKVLRNDSHTVLLTGFQSQGSNGNVLSNLSSFTPEERESNSVNLKFSDRLVTIKCNEIKAEISTMSGYSGHADQTSLLNYLFTEGRGDSGYTIPNIIINHGDNGSREVFKSAILERSKEFVEKYGDIDSCKTNIIIPKKKDNWYDLEKNMWVSEPSVDPIETSNQQNLYGAIQHLTKAIEGLTVEVSELKQNNLIGSQEKSNSE